MDIEKIKLYQKSIKVPSLILIIGLAVLIMGFYFQNTVALIISSIATIWALISFSQKVYFNPIRSKTFNIITIILMDLIILMIVLCILNETFKLFNFSFENFYFLIRMNLIIIGSLAIIVSITDFYKILKREMHPVFFVSKGYSPEKLRKYNIVFYFIMIPLLILMIVNFALNKF